MGFSRNLSKLADDIDSSGKLLPTAGGLPTQTSNSGKFLTTDGTSPSWGTVTPPTATAVSDTANSSTGYFQIPSGTTAQRPASPVNGMTRHNTTNGSFETYSTAYGWTELSVPPAISSITPVTFSGEQGTVFTINGANFQPGIIVKFLTNTNVEYTASTVTYLNTAQITAVTPRDFSIAEEPLSVKVINPTGTTYTAIASIDCGSTPTWTTASGAVWDNADDTSINATLLASDPDSGATITYAATGLPANTSINSSTGVITGLTANVTAQTTYNFSAIATDNAGNQSVSRSFSIITRPTVPTIGAYPLSGSNYAVYNTGWTGSLTNLTDLNHANSTFRIPANVYAIRVLVWGGGGVWNNGNTGGGGGFSSAILRVQPLEYFKVIVANAATAFNNSGGSGGTGLGGGCAQDGNDNGSGGAGSGIFYAANSSGTLVSSESTLFQKGFVIAGGGGSAGAGGTGGEGNGGSGGNAAVTTIAGINGYGIAGGTASYFTGITTQGGKLNGHGGDMISNSPAIAVTGNANGGGVANEGYGGSYVAGAGGGRGAGGGGGGEKGASASAGENPNSSIGGGRGSANYGGSPTYNNSGPGLGGQYSVGQSVGGNGFMFNGISLAGGGGGGHGSSSAGGGFGGGGSGFYAGGGGGGSGAAFGYLSDANPILTAYAAPNQHTLNGGNATTYGVPSTAGAARNNWSGGAGYNGSVLILW